MAQHRPRFKPVSFCDLLASQSLLRRHDLLLPCLQAQVLEELLERVVLPEPLADQARTAWLQGRTLESVREMLWGQRGWGAEDLEWQMLKQSKMQLLAQELFAAKAEAHFFKRKDQLDQVVYSLLRTQDANLARELYLQIIDGEADFSSLAKQYSDGPERYSQGIIGPKPLSAAHPALMERLRVASDGQVIEPFRVAEYWLVVRREKLEAAEFDQQASDKMVLELLQEHIKEEVMRRLSVLNHSSEG